MTLDRLRASAPHGVTSNLFGGVYAEGWIGYICGHVNPHENCKTNPERDIWELGWLDARRAGAREASPQWHKPGTRKLTRSAP